LIFDVDAGVRPGWQVLAAGLAVVAIDIVRHQQDTRVRQLRPKRRPA
jgi:methionine sulfoxide reductase heme-binding subunit